VSGTWQPLPRSSIQDGVSPNTLALEWTMGPLVSSTNGTNWTLETLATTSWGTHWPRFLSVANFNGDIVVTGQGSSEVHGRTTAPTDRYPNIWAPGLGFPALAIQSVTGTWRGVPAIYANYADLLPTINGLLAAGIYPSGHSVNVRADLLVGTNCSMGA